MPVKTERNFRILIKGEPEAGKNFQEAYIPTAAVYIAQKESLPTGCAMKELIVSMIFAKSLQAKGRVEGSNRTLQDSLVKTLRR
jgi:hypothetical protein